MTEPRLRARTLRRLQRKSPGGVTLKRYEKRKPSKAKCNNCGAKLSGVPHTRATRLHSMAKSQRSPKRPYGGMYCSKCTRSLIKAKVRQL